MRLGWCSSGISGGAEREDPVVLNRNIQWRSSLQILTRCGTRQRVSAKGTVWTHDFRERRCPGAGLQPVEKEFVPRDGVLPKSFRKQTEARARKGKNDVATQAKKAAGGALNVTDRRHTGTHIRSVVRGGLPGQDKRR